MDLMNYSFEFGEGNAVLPGLGYKLRVENAMPHKYRSGATAMRVGFSVVENSPGVAADMKGRTISDFFPLSGNGIAYTVPLLMACGVATSGASIKFQATDLIGKEVFANITEELYNGRNYTHVRIVSNPGSATT